MKRSILNKFLLTGILGLLMACSAKKPVLKPVIIPPVIETPATFSKAELLKKLVDSQVKYNTIAIKAKADLNINNSSNDVSMNIRMQKDKIIWVSVTAIAGIEVARALITPDSIKIRNRIENSYTKKPFSYIYQFASRDVNFNMLQDLFIGNAASGTLSDASQLEVNNGQTSVRGSLSRLVYSLLFNVNSNLIQSNLTDGAASQSLTVGYGNYVDIGGQALPQSVTIKSNASNKTIGIDLKYNHIEINGALDFPFSVPKNITIKN